MLGRADEQMSTADEQIADILMNETPSRYTQRSTTASSPREQIQLYLHASR